MIKEMRLIVMMMLIMWVTTVVILMMKIEHLSKPLGI